ncbi:MAG: Ribosomal RNA large subunit methyltransferase J [Methanosaeta sp. PtaU1.Bin112]|nr:MAG: Ribosomal RNA large subunit methyltransferase J [Methanosaeta sp. PtaU1.Bin112]
MGRYDHRKHAGNAGDVWKHLLLLEAANWLLASGSSLTYAESHAARPEYILNAPGEWQGGIGRIWPLLPCLADFCYFDILKILNQAGLHPAMNGRQAAMSGSDKASETVSIPAIYPIIYPGSARLIYELAKKRRSSLQADVWDNDAAVADAWKSFFNSSCPACSSDPKGIVFHRGDGFAGVMAHLDRSAPGLLFIDPPYVDPGEIPLAEELLQTARDRGWIVMWWYMMDVLTAPDNLQTFELLFSETGLDCGRWAGAVVALTGKRDERLDGLISHLHRRREAFIRILKLE